MAMNNQMINNVNCIVIGQREFNNWSAYGVLRLNRSRIHYFDCTEETFDTLMYSSTDFDNGIGVEYFFVVLSDDYQKNIIKRADSENFYLSFQAVNSLYALDGTAYRRMTGAANLAGVTLGLDKDLMALAKQWVNKHNQVLDHLKIKKLFEVFALEFNEQKYNIFEECLNKVDLSVEKINDRQHTMAYAWVVGSNYALNASGIDKKELSKIYSDNEDIPKEYKKLSGCFIASEVDLPLTNNKLFLLERKEVQKLIQIKESLLLFTLYAHYKMLIKEYFEHLGEQIFLALTKDVSYIKQYHSVNEAAQLVYWIGVLLPELFVSQLYYAKNSKAFKSIDAKLFNEVHDLLKKANLLTVSSENNPQPTPFIEQNSDSMMSMPTIQNDVQVEESIENHQDRKPDTNSVDIKSNDTMEDFERKKDDGDNLQKLILQIVDKDPDLRKIKDLEERIKEKFPDFKFRDWYNEQAAPRGYEALSSRHTVFDRKILKKITEKEIFDSESDTSENTEQTTRQSNNDSDRDNDGDNQDNQGDNDQDNDRDDGDQKDD